MGAKWRWLARASAGRWRGQNSAKPLDNSKKPQSQGCMIQVGANLWRQLKRVFVLEISPQHKTVWSPNQKNPRLGHSSGWCDGNGAPPPPAGHCLEVAHMRTEYDLVKHARETDNVQVDGNGSQKIVLCENDSAPKLPNLKPTSVLGW